VEIQMFRIRTFVCLIVLLSMAPKAAFAYGMSLRSTSGVNLDNRIQEYEATVLSGLAEAAKGLNIPADSKFEIVLGLDGKAQSASFISTSADDGVIKAFIDKAMNQTFGVIPGLDGDPKLTLTFTFAELKTPPYRRNSIQISGGGGTRISGGGLIVGGGGGIGSFDAQRKALDAQKPETPQEKEENVRANLRLARQAVGGGSDVSFATTPPNLKSEQQTNVQKCYDAAVKTLDSLDAASQGRLVTDFANFASRLALTNLTDTADSAVRKAIEIEERTNKGANPFGSRIIDKSIIRIVQQYRNQKQYPKAVSLLRYRIDKFKSASATGAGAGALAKFQDELASLLLVSSIKVPAQRVQLYEESNRVFKEGLEGISKNFGGVQSSDYRRAVMRRINELDAAGQPAASQALKKTFVEGNAGSHLSE
jgi:hypothetical protein